MNWGRTVGKQFEFDNSFIFSPRRLGTIDLYQIGELSCEAGFEIDSHLQLCHEISYIVSGSGKFVTDGCETTVRAGDIYLVGRGHIHAIAADSSSSLRYLYMGFNFNDLGREENAVINRFFENLPAPVRPDQNGLFSLFTLAINEFYNKRAFYSDMRDCFVRQIVVLAYRNFLQSAGDPDYLQTGFSNSAGATIYQIVRYIDGHIYELGSIRNLADRIGYSYGYITHVFKKKTGITLAEYIRLKKIGEAIRLFREDRMSITQIAEKLDFSSIQSFSKTFKKMTGESPHQYKLSHDCPHAAHP